MKLPTRASRSPCDLTYCTNIHPGETWPEVLGTLETSLLEVRRRVAPEAAFGIGLRLSQVAASTLARPQALDAFCAWLRAQNLYVRTINGFPYGPFHDVSVKDGVYRPDWSETPRVEYTRTLAAILSRCVPEDMRGSISTVPGGYRSRMTPDRTDAVARNLAEIALDLAQIESACGRHLALALEPEPDCLFETTAEAIAFFEAYVFRGPGLSVAARTFGHRAESILRRHLGLCLDLCHAAVEFEDPSETLRGPISAGIQIAKVQLSSGLWVRQMTAEALEALARFEDDVYLHQVVIRTPRERRTYPDLGPALREAASRRFETDEEWRIHFHVPIFHDDLGPMSTTQGFLREIIASVRDRSECDTFEIETYTWDVLPPGLREGDVAEAIAREYAYALKQWNS